MQRFVFLAVLICGFATPALAQQNLKDIPIPDPELERQSFQIAEGFEVNLYAADPLLAKPIQMNFDSKGRLWIASSEVYPQIAPGQKANDKVLILEDVDGDGQAEKTTVFAGGLLIPTGIEPTTVGAYVGNSTELLYLRDTDGDGKADQREVVLSGFGTEDTHHILHTLRWGQDGMLYFNQSVYIHSHLETPHGVRRLNGGGIWQLRPETMQLDVFVRGFVNPWGHHFDHWGQSFATDGAYGEGVNYLLPGAAYVTAVGYTRLVKGLNPGSPKHCGLELVGGRHLPEDWQGNAITNDFRGHRVCRFVLSEDGAGFASREQTEVIKTNHVAFRPIDVKMGPDGAIYIADWYNPIIQHGEVDFRDPRRDHTHGRIWRVTAKGRPLVERPQLVDASNAKLLEALKAPEEWTRNHAKRMLKSRGAAAVPELLKWIAGLDPKDSQYEHHRLEGLWTCQSLDVVDADLLTAVLHSPDYHARAAATRIVQHWGARLTDPLALLAERVNDEHPRVRLEAVRALAHFPSARSVEIAMQALDHPVDRYLDYALWMTAKDLEPYWMPALQAGTLKFGGNARHLTFALQSAGSPAIVKPLLTAVEKQEIAGERLDSVAGLIAALGNPDELAELLKVAGNHKNATLLAALVRESKQRNVRPAGDLASVAGLLNSEDDELRAAAAQGAGQWKLEALRPQLAEILRGAKTSATVRTAAAEGLAALGGEASRQALSETASAATQSLPVRLIAVSALASLDLQQAATRAAELLSTWQGDADPTPLFNAFLAEKNGPAVLATALESRKLSSDVAKIGVRAARSTAREEPALIDTLSKAGDLKSGVQTLTPEQMQQMLVDVQKLGKAERGEALFRRNDLACFRCHAIGGAGGLVGPDLVSIGASAQVDYLIDSLLQPTKQVKENYHSLVVVTDDGKVHTGIKVGQNDKELVLRGADDKTFAIALDAIEEQANGGSLMPVGLTDTLTRSELLDLVRFLSELGKVGPYAIGKARVVRRWQVPDANPLNGRRLHEASGLAGAHSSVSWISAYSRVSGELPLEEQPTFTVFNNKLVVTRCQLDVSTGGKIALGLNSAAGLSLWVDGKPTEVGEQTTIDLATGVHSLVFAVDLSVRKTPLRCELLDVAGSPAQAQIVNGK
jgi:putative heme-binding domain-containing protein